MVKYFEFRRRKSVLIIRVLLIALILAMMSNLSPTVASSLGIRQAQATLTVNPSSLEMKVGENATTRITLRESLINYGNVCFAVEGFPSSGFITWMQPECSNIEPNRFINSTLTVEATPAAAPQNFTAFVVAASGTWSEQVPITITVIPAMSAWIPWSIILVFILVLISPVLLRSVKRYRSRHARSA